MQVKLWTLASALAFLHGCVSSENNLETSVDPTLLWGPYRPNVFFGIRPRIPESLLMGLMWVHAENGTFAEENLRHACNYEGMAGYGWDTYDPRTGGTQSFHDVGNFIDITADLFKPPDADACCQWGVRITGNVRLDAPKDLESLVLFYVGTEERMPSEDSFLHCTKPDEGNEVKCYGNQLNLHNFTLQIRDRTYIGEGKQANLRTSIRSDAVPADGMWQAKDIYLAHVYSNAEQSEEGTLYFIENYYKGAFQFEVIFSSNKSTDLMSSTELKIGLEESASAFSNLFKQAYGPQPPFNRPAYTSLSKSLLSNLLGGIGYFYGDSQADRANLPEDRETDLNFWERVQDARSRAEPELMPARELFSAVPSRSFFPRGFLWDEGFHLLIVLEWDLDLAMAIVQSWLSLMDESGWIAREQILGSEARSAVPPQFRVQHPQHANPPTLFMVVSAFVDIIARDKTYSGHSSKYLGEPQLADELLKSIYPLLRRQYTWFRTSQAGDLNTYSRPGQADEGYRWRGRTPDHTLASGLDDYPRAQPPHPGELHLDAISWVGSMAQALMRLSEFLGENEDWSLYGRQYDAIKRNIESIHWSQEHQVYCDSTIDISNHTLVCHRGYVSLYPFLVGLMEPTHEHLGAVLNLISNETELWSPFGVRSLSKKDLYYGSSENYWRSPIWVNINYLILVQLLNLSLVRGPHQRQARDMYISLRRNLVTTVYNSWHTTGCAWEHYNPDTGAGQGVQHFTGWTALIIKIAAMPDLQSRSVFTSNSAHAWLTLDRHTIVSAAVLAIFVVVFRRNLARLWTSTLRLRDK